MFDEINKIIGGDIEIKSGTSEFDDLKKNVNMFIDEIKSKTGLEMTSINLTQDGATYYKPSDLIDKLKELTKIENLEDEENLKMAINKRIGQIQIDDPKYYEKNLKKPNIVSRAVSQLQTFEKIYSNSDAYKVVHDNKTDSYKPANFKWSQNYYDNSQIKRTLLMEKDGIWKICIEIREHCNDKTIVKIFDKYKKSADSKSNNVKSYHENNHDLDGGKIFLVRKVDGQLIGEYIESGAREFINDDDAFVKCVSDALMSLEEEYSKMMQEINMEKYKDKLVKSNNIIFRGAPGTGKTHLAQDLAAYIVSEGQQQYEQLDDNCKGRIGFVQFHPSYDYTDFVEGLRPIQKEGSEEIGFELKSGVFKRFCETAKQNQNPNDITKPSYVFIIDEINRGEISKILGELFFSVDPGYRGIKGGVLTQYSNLHNDPNSQFCKNPDDKFFIPENVYIIGTMNDIDRSVDTFDFAMRRRFRFIEIKPEDTQDAILNGLNNVSKIKEKMRLINKEISENNDLGPNYQLGAAYFSKLKDLDYNYNDLWNDFLEPLLSDYLQGTDDAENEMSKLRDCIIGNPNKPKSGSIGSSAPEKPSGEDGEQPENF